jgi:hypothetical protein
METSADFASSGTHSVEIGIILNMAAEPSQEIDS